MAIKFIISVTIISSIPRQSFSTAGITPHTAPHSAPLMIDSGSSAWPRLPNAKNGNMAPMAPICSCPSPPRLNIPPRMATSAPSATSSLGVINTSVSDRARTLPNAPSKATLAAECSGTPIAAISASPKISDPTKAPSVTHSELAAPSLLSKRRNDAPLSASGLIDSDMFIPRCVRLRALTERHQRANFLDSHVIPADLTGDPAAVHHHDAVGNAN